MTPTPYAQLPAHKFWRTGVSHRNVSNAKGCSFSIIKDMAQISRLTMVVPPRADRDINRLQLAELITDRMMQLGADVFDLKRFAKNLRHQPFAKRNTDQGLTYLSSTTK